MSKTKNLYKIFHRDYEVIWNVFCSLKHNQIKKFSHKCSYIWNRSSPCYNPGIPGTWTSLRANDSNRWPKSKFHSKSRACHPQKDISISPEIYIQKVWSFDMKVRNYVSHRSEEEKAACLHINSRQDCSMEPTNILQFWDSLDNQI